MNEIIYTILNSNNDSLKLGLFISVIVVIILFIISRVVIKRKIEIIVRESKKLQDTDELEKEILEDIKAGGKDETKK